MGFMRDFMGASITLFYFSKLTVTQWVLIILCMPEIVYSNLNYLYSVIQLMYEIKCFKNTV